VGIIDVSTLGGLEIRGPDAAAFLDRVYTFNFLKLPVGRSRYALLTDESGVILDDGVACRLHEQHFYVTATTSAVDQVYRLMGFWNQRWRMDVDIANVTAAYAAMNVGAFAVVGHFAGAGERYVTLEDYSGLGRRSPLLAAILTMFLLSLIGIPITGGFFAKFYVFSAALQADRVGLTIIGVLNSAVAAYYYLRVIVFMYMREPREEAQVSPVPAGLAIALALSLAATIYLGVLPGRVLEYAGQSVGLLR